MKRKSNSLSTEDPLQDNVVETAFPNVQHLMKIYFDTFDRSNCRKKIF